MQRKGESTVCKTNQHESLSSKCMCPIWIYFAKLNTQLFFVQLCLPVKKTKLSLYSLDVVVQNEYVYKFNFLLEQIFHLPIHWMIFIKFILLKKREIYSYQFSDIFSIFRPISIWWENVMRLWKRYVHYPAQYLHLSPTHCMDVANGNISGIYILRFKCWFPHTQIQVWYPLAFCLIISYKQHSFIVSTLYICVQLIRYQNKNTKKEMCVCVGVSKCICQSIWKWRCTFSAY